MYVLHATMYVVNSLCSMNVMCNIVLHTLHTYIIHVCTHVERPWWSIPKYLSLPRFFAPICMVLPNGMLLHDIHVYVCIP